MSIGSNNRSGLYYLSGKLKNGCPEFTIGQKQWDKDTGEEKHIASVASVVIDNYNPIFSSVEFSIKTKKLQQVCHTRKISNTAGSHFVPFNNEVKFIRENRFYKVEVKGNTIFKRSHNHVEDYRIESSEGPITTIELLNKTLFIGVGKKVYIDNEGSTENITLVQELDEWVEEIFPITTAEFYVNHTHSFHKWYYFNEKWNVKQIDSSEYDNKIDFVSDNKICLISQTRLKVFDRNNHRLIFVDNLNIEDKIINAKVIEYPLKDLFCVYVQTKNSTVYLCEKKVFKAHSLYLMQ